MCGIVGVSYPGGSAPIDPSLFRGMRDALEHRGPDDSGEWIHEGVALGFRRLSIIDLAMGHQPLGNEDGSVQIVFNGEIYNFEELRETAQARGHVFSTRSDTESIVHGYEEFGDQVVDHLRGMFAFGIWDRQRRRLLLARDRAGIKPLYYSFRDGRLAFSSEVHPLLRLPWVSRQIDGRSLEEYLERGYVPAPRTLLRDVRKLPAAHTLVLENGTIGVQRYWDPPVSPAASSTEEGLKGRLIAALDESVRTHLVSDVPLGAFLSGGLDSSIVVALMRRHSAGKLKTFSVGIDAPGGLNEADHARAVAEHLGTDHHELILTAQQTPDVLQAAASYLDEPVSDPAAVPTFMLAKLARESVTVVLTGEGADETWAGYEDIFRKGRVVGAYRRVPSWIRRSLTDPLLRLLPASGGGRLAEASAQPGYLAQLTHLEPSLRRQICRADATGVADRREEPWERPALDPRDPLHSITRDLIDTHLAERLLLKVDRMTMAHSLEARVPFLDHPLVEFALTVPARMKLRGRTTKYLLREAFQSVLPEPVLRRPKHAFDLPCAEWLRTTLSPMVSDLFASPLLGDYLDPKAVETLWCAHRRGQQNRATEIWALLAVELWARRFLGG